MFVLLGSIFLLEHLVGRGAVLVFSEALFRMLLLLVLVAGELHVVSSSAKVINCWCVM